MSDSSLRLIAALALASAGACDAQVSPSYTGESLLTVKGRVEISAERSESLVIPAIAFPVPERGDVHIRDVQVQGQFPSDFRLDVFEPPPADALFNATAQTSGEPRIALGYITAVAENHPERLRTATEISGTAMGCKDACNEPCAAPGCLVFKIEYCVADEPSVPCYVEGRFCPTFQSPMEDCTTQPIGNGDPILKANPLETFAGFSLNYVAVYLESPAPAASVTAARLGTAGTEVPAGYGLYAMRPLTEQEVSAKEACFLDAERAAAVGFNAEFGTNLDTLDFDALCGPQDPGDPRIAAPFCGGSDAAEVDRAFAAMTRYIERASVDLGCALSRVQVERVAEPDKQSISVVIGEDTQPLSFINP